jgi:hypothetical protein
MAERRWRGGATPIAQVNTFAFAGTWETDDIVRVTIGSKSVDITAGSATTATVVSTVAAAWAALDAADYPEFAEITPSANGTTLTLTATEAGIPFVATLTPLEAGGGAAGAQTIEGAGVATTGTAATASSGPRHWNTAANWTGGAVPANGDDAYLEDNEDNISFGLAQSGVTLANLYVLASFEGTLGLPDDNEAGYPEYRDTYLAIGATIQYIGEGPGTGSGRIRINNGAAQTALVVRNTGSPLDDNTGAVVWKGTHASNVVSCFGGSLDIAHNNEEVATVATLRVANAEVRVGEGTTLTTCYQEGGTVLCHAAFTTLHKSSGTFNHTGGNITTVNNNTGAFAWHSAGTIATYNGFAGSSLEAGLDIRTRALTACNLYSQSRLADPAKTIAFTALSLKGCKLNEVDLDVGYDRVLTVT